jgi:hypothetical protein
LAGNEQTVTYTLSVTGDRVLPVISIVNPDNSPAQSKTVTASADKGVVEMSITGGSVCDNSLTFEAYAVNTFTAEADNGKKVCYKASVAADNLYAYAFSDAIAGIDTTAPQILPPNFEASGVSMPEDPTGTYTLLTHNDPATTYNVTYSADTNANETLASDMFPLKLISTSVDISVLNAYYDTKPEPFKTYLKGAAAGTNPFAYVYQVGGDKTDVRIADSAVYDLMSNTLVTMRIPDDYPLGTYTVEGKIKDLAGNERTVTYTLAVTGDRIPPVLTITGATANGTNMSGNLEDGYQLDSNNDPATDYLVQFKSGTAANEPLASEFFGLKLTASTVSPTDLKAYYAARGVPEPFLTYLNGAADGTNPFVYIKGATVQLVDAAKHALLATDVDMTIPGDYPLGTYTVKGFITDVEGNKTDVTLKLIVAGDRVPPVITMNGSTPVDVVYGSDYTELGAIAVDDVDPSVAVTISGDTITASSVVGVYHVNYDAVDVSGNHATQVVRTVNVIKANSETVVTCPASMIYTGSALTPCTVAVTGAGGLNLTPDPDYSANTNVGTASASYTYAGDANHNGSTDTKNFAIEKATSTTVITCSASETYTGSPITPCTATVTGDGGLNESVAVTYTDNINVGTAQVGATYGGDANHSGSSDTETFAIIAKNLTVSATGVNKVYDGGTVATVTLSDDRVPDDDITTVYGGASFLDKNVADGKPVHVVDIDVTGPDKANYSWNTEAETTANITKNDVSVVATADNKVYDGDADATFALDVTGEVSGDIVTATGGTGSFDDKNVGSGKTVTVSGYALAGADAGNYNLTNASDTDTADITAAPLTITAQTNSKVYDSNISAAALPVVTGLQGTDTVSDLAEVYDNANVDTGKTLAVSAYTVNDGNGGANYAVTLAEDTTGVITAASATVTLSDLSYTYDGSSHAATVTTVPASLSVSVTYGGSATAPTNAGDYAVVATITDPNYSGSANGTLSIAKADATIKVDGYTGTYDAAAHGATGSAKGVGDVDLGSLLDLGSSFTNVPGGTAHWTFTDPDGNYNNKSGDVAIDISKADPTIVVTPYNVSFDGAAHTADGTAKGVSAETLAGLDLTGTKHTAAGTYATDPWTFTDSTGNYNDANGTVNDAISAASLTLTGTNQGELDTPTVVGQSYTVKWSVDTSGGTPTGNVTVSGGSECTAPVGDGQCDITSTEAGSKTLKIHYDGDTNFSASETTVTHLVLAKPTLIVKKHVIADNGGGAVAADFTITVNGTNVSSSTFAGDESGMAVTLDAGSYSVTETGPSGYAESDSADCTGTIANGDTKTCTITNDDIQPKLIVKKHVVNDNGGTLDASNWTINVAGTNATPSSFPGNESGTLVMLDAGDYAVSENTIAGYTPSPTRNCPGTIAVGQEKTCIITNDDQPGTLIVKKIVKNDDGTGTKSAENFLFNVNDGVETAFEADGQNDITVDAGTYTVTEVADGNYTTTYDNCTDVTVPNGGTATCTITNDDKTLVITQEAASTATTDSVTITWTTDHPATSRVVYDTVSHPVAGSAPNYGYANSTGETDTSLKVTSHSVTVTGLTPGTTYYFRSVSHGSPEVVSSELVQATAQAVGTLTVKKTTVGGDGTFGFTGTAGAFNIQTVANFGSNLISNLLAGTYTVLETPQAGWTQTATDCEDIDVVAGTNTDCTVTNVKQGNIIVKKVTVGGNGTFVFTPSWNNATEFSLQNGQENNSGYLDPGVYAVSESEVDGWALSSAVCSDGSQADTINLDPGETVTCTFTNTKLVDTNKGKIAGMKFEDKNGNGAKDAGEKGLWGWVIYLDANNNGKKDWNERWTVTNWNGDYRFGRLKAGTYTVREIVRNGWTQTAPSGGKYTVVLSSGQSVTGKNFGNFKLGSINGMKFNDKNGNGRKDRNEEGLKDWTIKLKLPNGTTVTTKTDRNGKYSFTGLKAGTHTVTEVQQSGWTQKTPNPSAISITSGKDVKDVNFGNKKNSR